MKYNITKKLLFLISLTALEDVAFSEETFQFKGFGTIGYSKAISIDDEAGTSPETKSYNGIDTRGLFGRDTRYGMNFSMKLNDEIRAVYQIGATTSNPFYGKTNNPELKPITQLMMLQYVPNDQILIRFGMQPTPLWLISEERDISFTYPWIRPPMEVYSMGEVDYMNGVSAAYLFDLGSSSLRMMASFGDVNAFDIPRTPTTDNTVNPLQVKSFVAEWEKDETFLRGVYALVNDSNVYYYSNKELSINGTNILARNQEKLKVESIQFTSIGCRSNFGDLSIMGEFADRKMKFNEGTTGGRAALAANGLLHAIGGYLTLGYQIDKFMPRITYASSKVRILDKEKVETTETKNLPEPAKSAVETKIGNAVRQEMGSGQNSWQLGVNYSVSSNVMMKLEFEQTIADDVYGGYNALPKGTSVSTVSFSSDFVF